MPAIELNHASGFNTGADLWAMADLKSSLWSKKIDWYVNFQLTEASFHQQPNLDSNINFWIKECELGEHRYFSKINQPWLVHSSETLPNRWVLLNSFEQGPEIWVNNIHQSWNQLGRVSLRVFLPESFSVTDFNRQWSVLEEFCDFGVVPGYNN
jgi:hypothetical protein